MIDGSRRIGRARGEHGQRERVGVAHVHAVRVDPVGVVARELGHPHRADELGVPLVPGRAVREARPVLVDRLSVVGRPDAEVLAAPDRMVVAPALCGLLLLRLGPEPRDGGYFLRCHWKRPEVGRPLLPLPFAVLDIRAVPIRPVLRVTRRGGVVEDSGQHVAGRAEHGDAALVVAEPRADDALDEVREQPVLVRGGLVDLHLVERLAAELVDLLAVVSAEQSDGAAVALEAAGHPLLVHDRLDAESLGDVLQWLPHQIARVLAARRDEHELGARDAGHLDDGSGLRAGRFATAAADDRRHAPARVHDEVALVAVTRREDLRLDLVGPLRIVRRERAGSGKRLRGRPRLLLDLRCHARSASLGPRETANRISYAGRR